MQPAAASPSDYETSAESNLPRMPRSLRPTGGQAREIRIQVGSSSSCRTLWFPIPSQEGSIGPGPVCRSGLTSCPGIHHTVTKYVHFFNCLWKIWIICKIISKGGITLLISYFNIWTYLWTFAHIFQCEKKIKCLQWNTRVETWKHGTICIIVFAYINFNVA